MHIYKLSNEQLAQILIPKRFVPPTPEEFKDKNWSTSLTARISLS